MELPGLTTHFTKHAPQTPQAREEPASDHSSEEDEEDVRSYLSAELDQFDRMVPADEILYTQQGIKGNA